MQFISSSVGPSTCGVFLSRVEVFLEGELGRSALDFIAPRGPSRFGQVNCWVDGTPPASAIPDELEKADLFILVGYPGELRARISELDPFLRPPSSIVMAVSCGDPDLMRKLRSDTGLEKIISVTLSEGSHSEMGLVLDSLVALHFFYENALSRFTLFDLRHIWPDGTELEVQRCLWAVLPDSPGAGEAAVSRLTGGLLDLDSPHLLAVLRGPAAFPDQIIADLLDRISPDPDKPRFWYAVAQPPASPEGYEAVVFSTARPDSLP
ncbi:MAG: hypothetical protein HPY50_19155 [Firmicutes bacterium]|nr:hypothetical protein [Bacillota bacterium]